MKMGPMDWVVMLLLIVGGLNWGLVGFFEYNLVDSLFGEGSMLARIVYDIVGLAALWSLLRVFMKGGSKSGAAPAAPSMPSQPMQ